jgi:hypothetical protein
LPKNITEPLVFWSTIKREFPRFAVKFPTFYKKAEEKKYNKVKLHFDKSKLSLVFFGKQEAEKKCQSKHLTEN